MTERKAYIAGNWKMNLDRARALDLIKTIKGRLGDGNDREVAVFPPAVYLADVSAVAQGSPLGVGSQNIFYEDEGAYTGELGGPMLREVGADRVLIGHSERRHMFREPDQWMGLKVRKALSHDLLPVLCIGETIEERRANRTNSIVRKQLESGLDGIDSASARRVTLAYEPVWAIGTGRTATPEQAQEAHAFVRERLVKQFGEGGRGIRVQYGGSVTPDNVYALMGQPDVDGALVGGASLDPNSFLRIVRFDRPEESS